MPIDISGLPEVIRLAEEVRAAQKARVLRRDGEDLALVVPLRPARTRRARKAKTQADHDAFLSSFGTWRELVDTEQLKRDIQESRGQAPRPPIEL
jgi:hypothetical protein